MNNFERANSIVNISIIGYEQSGPIKEESQIMALSILEEAEKHITQLRREVKKMQVIKGPDRIPPGLEPMKVIQVLDVFYKDYKMPDESWRGLWINIKTGQVVYHKDLCDPTDDGYLKGFQIAFDISTNKMVCRNCDNIWKSLDPKGFKRVKDQPDYKELYAKWTNK